MAATTLVTWDEFLQLPDPPEGLGTHYELHDGEVVIVPTVSEDHNYLQLVIQLLLQNLAGSRGMIDKQAPYRPQPNLQYWQADLAYIPRADIGRRRGNVGQWQVYTPPLIIEILSPSNTAADMHRQRMIALSSGAEEFWVVHPKRCTVEVTT